jgi:hypothetical protein
MSLTLTLLERKIPLERKTPSSALEEELESSPVRHVVDTDTTDHVTH